MTENNLDIPTQADLLKVPKDTTTDAVVIDLEVKTLLEVTKDETKKKNLKNPEQKMLKVRYESAGFRREDSFFLQEPDKQLTDGSKYGRLMTKYNLDNDPTFKPFVGMKVKVLWDDKGHSEIMLAK